jgi:hypothetical protein
MSFEIFDVIATTRPRAIKEEKHQKNGVETSSHVKDIDNLLDF